MSGPLAETLDALASGEDLSDRIAEEAMRALMTGAAPPAQVAGFLVALRTKGETVTEVAAMAGVMRELSLKVSTAADVVDTCGTGGDGSGSANLSTMAALVVAACGVPVAKHGNRSASSLCGSADVLEALGVAIDLAPEGVERCIEETGIGFCFAPRFHPAMRHVGPVRKELGIRTVFNLLGPLTNPASARRQVVGVAAPRIGGLVAGALASLGSEHAIVVHGADGLDEVSTAGPARTWTVRDGKVEEGELDPSALGFSVAPTSALAGGDPERNAEITLEVLSGGQGPVRDAVVLNAALGLVVSGTGSDHRSGVERAQEALDSGAALRTLERLRDVSRAAAGGS